MLAHFSSVLSDIIPSVKQYSHHININCIFRTIRQSKIMFIPFPFDHILNKNSLFYIVLFLLGSNFVPFTGIERSDITLFNVNFPQSGRGGGGLENCCFVMQCLHSHNSTTGGGWTLPAHVYITNDRI